MSFPECQWWGSTIELVSNVHIYKNEPIISFKSRPEVTYFVIYYSHIYNPDKLDFSTIKSGSEVTLSRVGVQIDKLSSWKEERMDGNCASIKYFITCYFYLCPV